MITQRTPRSFGYSVLMIALATSAFAQFDTQHDHLKCYKITGGAIVTKVQTDNQFGREMIFKLVPKFLCAPTQKTCVATDGSGNSTSGTFTVSVKDTTHPTLNLHGTITAEATSPSGAAVSY